MQGPFADEDGLSELTPRGKQYIFDERRLLIALIQPIMLHEARYDKLTSGARPASRNSAVVTFLT